MRDHSSRTYNKKKVVRFRTKSQHRANGPFRTERFKYADANFKKPKPSF